MFYFRFRLNRISPRHWAYASAAFFFHAKHHFVTHTNISPNTFNDFNIFLASFSFTFVILYLRNIGTLTLSSTRDGKINTNTHNIYTNTIFSMHHKLLRPVKKKQLLKCLHCFTSICWLVPWTVIGNMALFGRFSFFLFCSINWMAID